MDNESSQLVVFSLISFSVTYLLEIWLWLSGGLIVWFAAAVLTVVMFVPLLSAAATVKLVEHGSLKSQGMVKGKGRYYLYSLVYPFAVIALGLLIVAALGTTSIDFTMSKFKEIFPNLPFTNEIPLV